MKKQKNQGITLIALVVTIIVLLILAGVTIAMLTGDNGILKQANNAKQVDLIAKSDEERRLFEQEMYLDNYYDAININSANKIELTTSEASAQGWVLNTDHKTIMAYSGSDETVYIPSTIGGYTVQALNTNLFHYNTRIKTLVVPGNVKKIAASACVGCSNIEKVILQEGIEEIDVYAFNGCVKLNYLVLPSTITKIDTYGLACTGIKNIVIPSSVETVGDSIFGWCRNPVVIHCEAESKPEGWSDNWLANAPEGTTVDWGYKK